MASGDAINDGQYPRFLLTKFDPAIPGEMDEIHPEFCYKMNHENRGIALIINNERFKNMPFREGSQEDAKLMEEVWNNLGFKVITFTNLSAEEIKKTFEMMGREDHTKNDCFVVVILTRGDDNDVLYGSDDEKVSLRNLVNYLYRCPSLTEKPKLIFVQAGRGTKFDSGKVVPGAGQSPPMNNIPSWPDVLIHYSTIPGFHSWRHTSTGSWFIQSLGAVLKNHGKNKELNQILTMVNWKVAHEYESKHTGNPETEGKKQMPVLSSSLTKLLYFA